MFLSRSPLAIKHGLALVLPINSQVLALMTNKIVLSCEPVFILFLCFYKPGRTMFFSNFELRYDGTSKEQNLCVVYGTKNKTNYGNNELIA